MYNRLATYKRGDLQPIILKRRYSALTIGLAVYAGGTRWFSWLRHCATSRKVAGSIHDGVIGIFHLHNPSSPTVALGLTQPLTEMGTRNISLGVMAAGA